MDTDIKTAERYTEGTMTNYTLLERKVEPKDAKLAAMLRKIASSAKEAHEYIKDRSK